VNGERRHQKGFSIATREQRDELVLGPGCGADDPILERLQVESDPLTEQAELHPIA